MTTPFIMDFNSNRDCFDQKYIDGLKSAFDKFDIVRVTTKGIYEFLIQEREYKKACQKKFISLCYSKAMAKLLQEHINIFNDSLKVSVDEESQKLMIDNKVVSSYEDIMNSLRG